jgi:hypothetical protein
MPGQQPDQDHDDPVPRADQPTGADTSDGSRYVGCGCTGYDESRRRACGGGDRPRKPDELESLSVIDDSGGVMAGIGRRCAQRVHVGVAGIPPLWLRSAHRPARAGVTEGTHYSRSPRNGCAPLVKVEARRMTTRASSRQRSFTLR